MSADTPGDELARLLAEAYEAEARRLVPDGARPRRPLELGQTRRRRILARRALVPLAAACGVAATAVVITATRGDGSRPSAVATRPGEQVSSSAAPTPRETSSTSAAPRARPVHLKLLNADGSVYGVGMPVIAFFSRRIGSGKALQDATKVTVNGQPAVGAWYFEMSAAGNGPIEGHFRLQQYWPAHSRVHVDIPARGLSAGPDMVYDDSLTLDFSTGAKNVSIVNDATHEMTVTSDGKPYGTFPVSLGAEKTPTARGTKVIMEKGVSICMHGPGYDECGIKYTQRLTYGGEYLHSAPWNVGNIGRGVDSSNGCTNLLPADAKKLYHFLQIGDVVQYPNANGPQMQLGSGYGDWNVTWPQWLTGGLISTNS